MSIPESLKNDWAMDVDESNGLSLVVSMDTRPTEHVNKVMTEASILPPLVTYGPHNLSALYLGTQKLSATATIDTTVHSHHGIPQR